MDLRLENLTKRFGEKNAVTIPTLTIHDGEFFTFVGPSGCGKSTTLNIIAGLEDPTTGTIRLGERLLHELPPQRRDVAFVFQSYALYPHRTVYGNLAFPLELAGLEKALIRQRVDDAAAMLGLTPLLEKRPRQLSGGERQRVALGRAIVRQPQLFLFDEPLSNLDAPLRAQMRKELKRLHQQLQTTFVYVTHDQEEALSLSDRIAVMRDGRIQQCGTPREVYEEPANRFVGGFFGSPSMSFLEAGVTSGESVVSLRVGEHCLELGRSEEALRGKTRVVAGVRPEHAAVSREASPGAWPVDVLLAERHGGQMQLELGAGSLRLTSVVAATGNYQPGEKLWLVLSPERIHLFDSESGERIRVVPSASPSVD